MALEYRSKEEFFELFQNEIRAEARILDDERLEEEVFTEKMLEYLNDSNFTENVVACRHKGRGLKVDAYDINTTQNAIDIIVTLYDNDQDEIYKVGKPDIDKSFKWARSFLEQSRIGTGLHEKIEDSAEAFDLSKLIHENYQTLKRARIILITNGFTGAYASTKEKMDDFEINFQVYDFERLWRNISSGMKKEVITLEFEEEGYDPIPAISISDGRGIYTTYISLIPGALLKDLYDRYGTRLLERNVRAFLQARSKVNKGIRDTIIERPNMFLAYNNGITVTAQSVSLIEDSSGNHKISRIKDFQVVNGGQTTASLWHTATKNKANINNVYLQLKLTVINKAEMIDEIAPLISQFSNAQNAVNTADFSANSPFHINLERVSISIWVPDPTGGNIQTKWFYERARGSYFETRALERTPARIRGWDLQHPRTQKFDKLMLGKVENTWRRLPHIVSLGAQKCFANFTVFVEEQIGSDNEVIVDEKYFKDIIAKIIIWKSTERIISRQKTPGWRAQTVTYSLSWLLLHETELFDLNKIWLNQKINEDFEYIIDNVTRHMRNKITSTDGNVGEWCKKEELWNQVKKLKIDLDKAYEPEEKAVIKTKQEQNAFSLDTFTDKKLWIKLSKWIEKTKELPLSDAEFCINIVKAIVNNGAPTFPQMRVAGNILNHACEKGFNL